MNKKLLAVAIGAALSAPMLAQADVKVGGIAQVEIAAEELETTVGTVTTTTTTTTTEDNSRGRFWITADEDLGNGMKGLAHFEFRVDTTGVCAAETGGSACVANAANTREKWVGLQTKLGTVKLGSVRQPYKYAGGVTWDAFVTTNLEARGNGGMSGGVFGHNNFFDNSVSYASPSFAGVSFGIAYSFDDVSTDTGAAASNLADPTTAIPLQAVTADDGDYSAAVEWKSNFGLHLIAALSHNANNAEGAVPTNDTTTDSTKIGAKFTFAKNYSVIAQYEQLEGSRVSGVTDVIDDKVYFLAFHATIGPVLLALQYGNTEQSGAVAGATAPLNSNNDIDYLALGAFYNFSKTFNVFGGYRATNSSRTLPAGVNDSDTTVYTLGMRKTF